MLLQIRGYRNQQNQEYSNFLHTYCYVDYSRDIYDRSLVTSPLHIFNNTITDWCANKQSETYWSIPNAETREMCTGVLDQNWIRNPFKPIGYPIGPPSKIHEDNQSTIIRVLAYIITPQARPLDVLITALHEHHIQKILEMVDTRSNMKLVDLTSKPHGEKSLRDITDCVIGVRFYPHPGSEN